MVEHEIVIRFKLPHWSKRRILATVAALVVGSAALAYGAVPNTFKPRDTLSASRLNENFSYLQDQITTSELGNRQPSAFHASLTKETLTNDGIAIAFDQVDFDVAGEYNEVTGAFVSRRARIYVVNCNAFFTSQGTPTTWGLSILRNGSAITIVDIQSSASTVDGGGIAPASTTIVQLAAGDAIACTAGVAARGGAPQAFDTNNPARNTFSAARLF